MVEIPAGTFLYGSGEKERSRYLVSPDEPKQHEVELPAFSIGKYEVTNREFERFIEDGGYQKQRYWSEEGWEYKTQFGWTQPRRWTHRFYHDHKRKTNPVCALSWFEAQAFCRWLQEKTGKPYRLPTSKEWEKAARGTDGRIFPWGNEWEDDACNWLVNYYGDFLPDNEIDGAIYTAAVGTYEKGKSPYGCYEMSGNVMEWCADTFTLNQRMYAVLRGGSFYTGKPRLLRCAWQGGNLVEVGHVYWGFIGFRVAMDHEETKAPEHESSND